MSLVFKTSTGLPTIHAVNPAMAEETMWQGTPSSMRLFLTIISLTWSKVAISAALMIEFLIMLGPSPVHKPLILSIKLKLPFLCNYFLIGLRDCLVSPLILGFFSLSLEPDLNNISRIRNHDPEGSSSQGCQDSSKHRNRSLMVGSYIKLLDWFIEANPQTCEHHLSL